MADIFEDGFVDTSQHTYRDFSVPNTDPFGVSIFANTDSDGVPTSYSYSFNQAYAFNAAISGDLNRASGVISGMEDSFTVPVGEDVEFKVGLKINKQNFIIQDAVFYTGEPSQEGEDLSSGLYPIFGYKSEDNDEGKIYTGIYQICTVRDGSVITRTTRDNIYLDNIQIKQLGTTGAPTNGEGGQVHLIQESGQYDSSVPILFRGISGGSGVQVTYDSTNASGGNFIVIDSTGSAGGGATPNYTNLGFGADVYDESSSSPNADFRSLTGAHRTESLDATKIYVTQDTNVIRFSGQAVRLSNTGNIGSSVKLYVDSPETGPATESKAAFREIYSDDSSIDIGLVNSNNTIDIGFNSGKYKPYYNWTGENIGAHGENVYKNTTGPASNTKAQFHKISGVTVNQGDNTESSQKASVNVATSDNVIKISVDLSTAQAAGAQEPYLGQSSLPTGSFIAGGTGNAISGHYNVISAGALNKISGGQINFIGGGSGNDVNFSRFSSSLGGRNNDVSGADFSVILGGNTNLVTGGNAHVIGGGDNNQISGDNSEIASTIVGGTFNKILGNTYSFIGAGGTNTIYANNSVINGGTNNIASGNSSVVFGGSNNKVLADYGVAAGRYSKVQATHNGAFVLSDSNTSETLSSGANTLTLNFKSGVYVDSDSGIYINGNPVLTGVSGSEGDTLQIVTDRGATTTNAITLQNSLTLSYNYPRINLTDTDNNSDYSILNNDGSFGIYDVTNSAYRLQILSGGNVGIGAVTPLSRLHIGNATGSTLGLRFTNPTETVNQYFADDSTDSDFFITYAGNGGAEITLQHDGKLALNASNGDNVGVGTDNPRTSLHVSRAGTTEGGIITIDNPNNTDGSYCGIEFINSTVGYPRSAIFAQRTGGYDAELTFHTSPTNEITGSDYPAATERMRIDHDGNVGIGTNSPSGFSSSARRLVIGEGAASEGMSIFAGTSSNASIYFADGAAGSAAYQGFVQYKHGDSRMDFGAAGGRRMIMNGNGLLIAPNGGVFSPSAELEIASSAATLRLTDTDLTNHYSEIEKAGVYTYLSSRANAADGGFIFFGGGTDTEFMRIETDGKVGIGSASPSFVLDTVFTGDNGARLRSTDNHSSLTVQSHASYGAYLRFSDGGNRYWLQARSDDKLQFRPNASLLESACIYFDETGNVGIGVSNPSTKLEVVGPKDADGVVTVGDTTSVAAGVGGEIDFEGVYQGTTRTVFGSIEAKKTNSTAGHYGAGLALSTRVNGGGGLTERLTILEGGNVGIGTNNPVYDLTIGGNAVGSTGGLRINDPSNVAYGAHFSFADTPNEVHIGGITNNVYNDAISINRESTRTITINGSEQVGIGTTAPSSKLEVYGAVSDSVATFKDGSDGVEITTRGSSRQQIDFLGSNTSTINAKGSLFINYDSNNNGSNDNITFARNGVDAAGTVDMVITEGNVGIGTTDPQEKLNVSGNVRIDDGKILMLRSSGNTYGGEIYKDGYNGTIDIGSQTNIFTNVLVTKTDEGSVQIGESSLYSHGRNAIWPLQAAKFAVYAGVTDDGGTGGAGFGFFNQGSAGKMLAMVPHSMNSVQGGFKLQTMSSSSVVEAMYFDTDGSIGVGTSSPSDKFHVEQDGGTVTIGSPTTSYGGIGFEDTALTAANSALYGVASQTVIGVKAGGAIEMKIANNSSIGLLKMETNKLHYTNGSVGIGLTNPAGDKLMVKGDDGYFASRLDGSTTAGQSMGLRVRAGYNSTDRPVLIEKADGSDVFIIDGLGNVGIGSAPSYELDVSGTTRSTYYIGGAYLEENASSSKLKFYSDGTILVMDEDGELKPCEKENDALVFGVSKKDFDSPVVLGAEPVLVTGPIKLGDYIVTSNKQGHGKAMKEQNIGTIIAQAMESGDGESYNIKAMVRKM